MDLPSSRELHLKTCRGLRLR